METEALPPTLSAHIDRYLRLWETVKTREFTVDEVRRMWDTPDIDWDGEQRQVRESLDTLVAYGLLDWHGDERYRIRLRPDEPLDKWLETMAPRVTGLYDAVQSATVERKSSSPAGEQTERLEFEGATYDRRVVSSEETVESVVMELTDANPSRSDVDGVVLTAPADEAAHVQRIADQLCDGDAMADLGQSHRFEKVTSEVLGADPDALEYRLYLTRTDVVSG